MRLTPPLQGARSTPAPSRARRSRPRSREPGGVCVRSVGGPWARPRSARAATTRYPPSSLGSFGRVARRAGAGLRGLTPAASAAGACGASVAPRSGIYRRGCTAHTPRSAPSRPPGRPSLRHRRSPNYAPGPAGTGAPGRKGTGSELSSPPPVLSPPLSCNLPSFRPSVLLLRHRRHRPPERPRQPRPFLLEQCQLRTRDRLATAEIHPPRVSRDALHPELIVQVRTGGETRGSHVADHLALAHPRPRVDPRREAAEVAVARGDPVPVAQLDQVPVPPGPPGPDDGAVPRGEHRRPRRRGVVGALVPAPEP